MVRSEFTLDGFGGQHGAFVKIIDERGQVLWIYEVCPSLVNEADRHVAIEPGNRKRELSVEDFAALDPQPLLI